MQATEGPLDNAGSIFMTDALIEQLAGLQPPYADDTWQGWRIRPIASGNNLLFRATRDDQDCAVKFMIRDRRNRAQHEFDALTLIDGLSPRIGPRPVFIDRDRYHHAVVVQTWIDGSALQAPPTDDSTWSQIVETYALVHQIHPAEAQRQGCASVIPAAQTVAAIRAFAQELPATPYAAALASLLAALEQAGLPEGQPARRWCHGDPNIRNILVTPTGVQLVDWEYSGIGDPAQEIAGLLAHPFARSTSAARRKWVAERYAQLSSEPDMLARVHQQYALQLAWWCVRLVFGRYVLLQRPSQRLVGPRAEEEISTLENIEHYLSRAQRELAEICL
jgi:thiamine kinase-like enzyme